MVTKQMLQEKLENLTPEQINQIYDMIETLTVEEKSGDKPSFLSKIQQIKIDAPEDFSVKLAINFGRDVSEE
ncbi:MAG: hypothetical protein Fur0025_36150 [Oscillatoriaceae cyanobacterium]